MQIASQLFDKFPYGIIHIGDQGITAGLNHRHKIIRCPDKPWDWNALTTVTGVK